MEYFIVRIYRREQGQVNDGDLGDMRMTGLVENDKGHKDSFHDAETLWKLLAQESIAIKTHGPGSK